jgi:hypothetical protein
MGMYALCPRRKEVWALLMCLPKEAFLLPSGLCGLPMGMYALCPRRKEVWALLMCLPKEAFLLPSGLCNALRVLPLGKFYRSTSLTEFNVCSRSMGLLDCVTLSLPLTCSRFLGHSFAKAFGKHGVCC